MKIKRTLSTTFSRRRCEVYGRAVRAALKEYRDTSLPRYARERAWRNAIAICRDLDGQRFSDWGLTYARSGRDERPIEITYRGPRGGTRARIHYRNGRIGVER